MFSHAGTVRLGDDARVLDPRMQMVEGAEGGEKSNARGGVEFLREERRMTKSGFFCGLKALAQSSMQ